MPVCMGILCERCRTVYFISRFRKSAHIHYDRTRGDFKLSCILPCQNVAYFHRTMLRPYSVSVEAIERGYANIGECQPMVRVSNLSDFGRRSAAHAAASGHTYSVRSQHSTTTELEKRKTALCERLIMVGKVSSVSKL